MDEKIHQLIEQHHAYYEVSPYYLVINVSAATRSAETRMIQHGFDVDVYGIKASGDRGLPAISPDYALGSQLLQELAKTASSHSTDKCSIRITPFGSTEFLDPKDSFAPSARLQVRITMGGALISLPEFQSNKRCRTLKSSSRVWVSLDAIEQMRYLLVRHRSP